MTPIYPEHYDGEHDDLRFEYATIAADEELEQLREDTGCTDQCPSACDCVQLMLEGQQDQRDLEREFWQSR